MFNFKNIKIITFRYIEKCLPSVTLPINETNVYDSFKSVEELEINDPSVKFVGAIRTGDGIKVRYISDKVYDSKVQTTLDDVYLDYLG